MFALTALYATPLVLIFLVLSWRVISYRRNAQISLGDGGDTGLTRRMRAQANCAEYAPFGLLLLALVEAQGPAVLVHVVGATLVAGRALHAYGFSARPPRMELRAAGMVLTLLSMGLAAIALPVIAIL
ncbi:MAG: MAPEG family protein [Pseudomonadota bacterium]